MTRRALGLPLPMYRVEIKAHRCERWIVPKQTHKLVAYSADDARLFGVRQAHITLGMPAWRPLLELSMPYATATPTSSTPNVPVVPRRDQLQLPLAA
jgi:hypothetical protein